MKKTASAKYLCADSFLSDLKQFSKSNKFWIAFSGGVDSSVLLHLFYLIKNKIHQKIQVLYVNHGLQREADDWGEFCKEQCQQYELPFIQLQIIENCPRGKSIEAWAREKRYFLIEEMMNKNDVLFTGHHIDDQVETFFLQALRGAGPRGLASMPVIKKNVNTFHVRPLLDYSRDDLKYYADANDLAWKEDQSNLDIRYDRNYLRHKLIPILEKKWPAYRETINRLINNQKKYKSLLDEIALDDLKLVQNEVCKGLNLNVIKEFSVERQKNLLFFWLKKINLKTPSSKNIEKIISDIIFSSIDKSPCVNWGDVEVRRYKNIIYASDKISEHDVSVEYKWKSDCALTILNETIFAESVVGKGISKEKVKELDFIVRYRQGGEKIYPLGFDHSISVKKLFQERSVLPWLRDRIPLIYIDSKLAIIPGFCIDKRFAANKDESSLDIRWSGYERVIQRQ